MCIDVKPKNKQTKTERESKQPHKEKMRASTCSRYLVPATACARKGEKKKKKKREVEQSEFGTRAMPLWLGIDQNAGLGLPKVSRPRAPRPAQEEGKFVKMSTQNSVPGDSRQRGAEKR